MYQIVLDFWFNPENKAFWFKKSADFDEQIKQRFFTLWEMACENGFPEWRKTLDGRLAEIIVLDQFSRNLARDSGKAFAQDDLALQLAKQAVAQTGFADLPAEKRHFMLMPFMHCEELATHKEALKLFEQYAPHALDFEQQHLAIIEQFGRYPHRNAVLGRESTEAELAFMQTHQGF